jgi:hypothetical protein
MPSAGCAALGIVLTKMAGRDTRVIHVACPNLDVSYCHKRHGRQERSRQEEVVIYNKAMKGVIEEEGDIPSNTKLSCVLLDLVKSRVFSMFQYSLLISPASIYR